MRDKHSTVGTVLVDGGTGTRVEVAGTCRRRA